MKWFLTSHSYLPLFIVIMWWNFLSQSYPSFFPKWCANLFHDLAGGSTDFGEVWSCRRNIRGYRRSVDILLLSFLSPEMISQRRMHFGVHFFRLLCLYKSQFIIILMVFNFLVTVPDKRDSVIFAFREACLRVITGKNKTKNETYNTINIIW